jgi:hypothetical protein
MKTPKELLKSITDPITEATAVDDVEPTGDTYRPIWRGLRPLSLDICMGPIQFSISYSHIYLTLTATEFYSAFWIILPFMTYIFEGENLKHVVRSITEREARALYLFDGEIHKKWDPKKGRILKMQPVLANSDAAFAKAAETFGIDTVTGKPPATTQE